MVNRMMRAVQADVTLYEEAEHTPALQQEAYTIVGIVAAVNAIFALIWGVIGGNIGAALLSAVVTGAMAVVGYLIWSFLTFYIGTNVFKGTGDLGEVQRSLGYAWTPQILTAVLSGIPILGCLGILPWIWSIYLGFVATRQSLDLDNQNAAITVGLAFLAQAILGLVIGLVLGVGTGVAAAITGQ